ncbi:hypothetical protein GCM10010965_12530 [Caldalkalibacillus thermarum]|uniref:DUF3800 domain-containing protein n=1 Tax=Caldalkalibacillus thermarum TaxID=296745 RepID=UPI001668ACD0|nr:DUF3800 domain-containing protein [Caldalkalibacillus thermarum]GGK20926.1 hypothetical protein GCM10010965_12530 [Caldalkalibacillus thermarum]
MEWKRRPTILEYWPKNVDVLMGMDENGTAELKGVKRRIRNEQEVPDNEKYFTLTGVAINLDSYSKFKEHVNKIKFKHWENGMADYKGTMKRVCFHSSEIRKRKHPFDTIDYEEFMNDISKLISSTNIRIISSTVNKEAHYKKYGERADHPYPLAVRFILERYCKKLNETNQKGIIVLESRGKKEDKFVLKHILQIIENGTYYNPASHFKSLVGVYFNPKWWAADDSKSSFVILELADLVSYPIHKFARSNCIVKDRAFLNIEEKLTNYPNYMGWGIKIFP